MCSNDFMATTLQVPASDWRFAYGLSNDIRDESGWNPNPGKDRSFISLSPSENKSAGRPHILVVEDNSADVYLIREALNLAHIDAELQVARDGTEALALLNSAADDGVALDLVLLDLNLPKLNGEQVLQNLRTSARYQNVRVLIITSTDSAQEREKMTQLGIVAYFRKPSDYNEFLKLGALVKMILETE